MRTARRVTGWRHGVAVLVAVGFAMSVAVVPTGHRVLAEEPLIDPAPTTVPESAPSEPTSEPTVPAEPVGEPTVPAEPTTEPTVPAEATTEPTVPAETSHEPDVGGQDTTGTVAETTTVSTTIEPPTPEPADAPAARFAPFSAAGALTGLMLTITDLPFAVNPTTLAFDTMYVVGSNATETVELVNGTGRLVVVEAVGVDGVSVTGVTGCPVLGPGSADDEYVLEAGESCNLFVTVDTSSVGPVTGQLVLSDTNIFRAATATVTAEVVKDGSPVNDDWENAEDLSPLTIPEFGDDPNTTGLQPVTTVEVPGTTELATLENDESPTGSGGSVWYSYASPPGSFTGRLGYRVTQGFVVEAFAGLTSAETPLGSSAPGGDWQADNPFVRMETDHTVWFRVSSASPASGPFSFELFQAPNLQDDIANAEEIQPDFVGDADTFHVTEDFEGGPNAWYSAVFTQPGTLSVTAYSLQAARNGPTSVRSARPFDLLLYRSPTTTPVGNTNDGLEWVAGGAAEGVDSAPIAGLSGSGWRNSFAVQVEPGRYYWSFARISQFQEPTWLRFDTTFTAKVIEPVISISGPLSAAVGGTASVTVTATNPDATQPVEAGFQFGLEGEFVERVLENPSFSSVVDCKPVPGDNPPRGFTCTSSAPLAPGDSVTATFTVSTPSDDALTPCQQLNRDGKRTGPTDHQGPVCLNVVAYPGPVDPNENPINRAVPGKDAAMVSIPLVGSYVRFTASATDAPPGGTVTVTVTPRNAGTESRTGIGFQLDPTPKAELISTSVPSGWTCQLTSAESGTVGCTAPSLTLGAGQASAPLTLTFTAPPVPSPTSCPGTVFPLPTPAPNPCGTFQLGWVGIGVGPGGVTIRRSYVATQVIAYRIGDPPTPTGPCVIVETPDVDFGEVAVGSTSPTLPVVVRSCSDAPVRLEVSVSNATGGAGSQTWLAGTSTVPSANQFTWSVTPPGGPSPIPVGPTQTSVGLVLAPFASRTDDHRITLGPTGPGLGTRFTSTFTYTALTT